MSNKTTIDTPDVRLLRQQLNALFELRNTNPAHVDELDGLINFVEHILDSVDGATAAYKYRVIQKRTFVDGFLKGVTIDASARFFSKSAAIDYCMKDDLIITPAAGTSSYKNHDSRVEPI